MSIFRSLMAQQRNKVPTPSLGGYVTDGLVFMIDALWNDAIDTPQNPMLAGIRDLVSGTFIPFEKSPYKYNYSDDALSIDSGNKDTRHSNVFNTGKDLRSFAGMTVEQVDMPGEWKFSDTNSLSQSPIKNSAFAYSTAQAQNWPSTDMEPFDIIRSYFTQSSEVYGYEDHYLPESLLPTVHLRRHLSCAMLAPVAYGSNTDFPDHISSLRIDGRSVSVFHHSTSMYPTQSPFDNPLIVTIGANSRMNMKLFSYRIYNRALTPAEQAQNYAIDRKRFNL